MIQISVTNATIYIVATIIISTTLIVILVQTYISGRVQLLESRLEELNKHLEAIEMRPRAIVTPTSAQQPVQRHAAPATPLGSAWVWDKLPEQPSAPVQPAANAEPVEWWRGQ